VAVNGSTPVKKVVVKVMMWAAPNPPQ
jgi:hypothetical protein